MKDWKTYAIIVLAAWSVWLTWRTMPNQVFMACHDANVPGISSSGPAKGGLRMSDPGNPLIRKKR